MRSQCSGLAVASRNFAILQFWTLSADILDDIFATKKKKKEKETIFRVCRWF